MKKNMALILIVLLFVSGFSACGKSPIDEQVVWAADIKSTEVNSFDRKMDMDPFDEKFLEHVSQKKQGNYMTSPLSFRYALGLLLAGAEGDTKAELIKALEVNSEEEWNEKCLIFNGVVDRFKANLQREIDQINVYKEQGWMPKDGTEPYRALRVANSVWKAERIKADFKEDYRKTVEQIYAAEYRSFTPKNAVEKINEWADIKTEHMISKLLPDNYPTDMLAVVLMNALYFKDAWENEFDKGATHEADFYARSGQTVRKEFMSNTDHYSYYEDKDTKLVILPMKGGIYMAFVLGSQDGLSEKIAKADFENVKVTIPKIDLETDLSGGELVDFLKDSGVKLAFDAEKADFSAMLDNSIYVSDIIQKTRLKLDEEGVEAAAVTAVMVAVTALWRPEEPKEFTADKPFSFYIYTTCNDFTSLMFAGEIVE